MLYSSICCLMKIRSHSCVMKIHSHSSAKKKKKALGFQISQFCWSLSSDIKAVKGFCFFEPFMCHLDRQCTLTSLANTLHVCRQSVPDFLWVLCCVPVWNSPFFFGNRFFCDTVSQYWSKLSHTHLPWLFLPLFQSWISAGQSMWQAITEWK